MLFVCAKNDKILYIHSFVISKK